MLDTILRITDGATKFAQERAKAAAAAHISALASSGYRLRQRVKEGMKQQAPGDVTWPAPSPWVQFGPSLAGRARSQQRRLERRKRGPRPTDQALFGTKGRTPLAKLAAASRYEKLTSGGETRVRVGFLNARLQQLAAYHAEAHTVPVTAKMRRLIFAVGLGIRKTTISIPKREHVGAVYRRFHGRVADFIQKRIWAAFGGQDPKGIQPPF